MLTAAPSRNQPIVSETIEWTWEVKPEHPQPALPNVLLVGDSITRNYFPTVTKSLEGKANVYLFATSACAGDPRLPAQLEEFFAMYNLPFRVIHFNNGMHGWGYSESQYMQGLQLLIRTLRKNRPAATLVWANTTPVRKDNPDGATNERIYARNLLALKLMERNHIVIDDQFKVVKAAPDDYSDDVHPNPAASKSQGQQAADLIDAQLH